MAPPGGLQGDERRQVYECLRHMRETERKLTALRTTLSGIVESPARHGHRPRLVTSTSSGLRRDTLLNLDGMSDVSSTDGKAFRHGGLTPPMSPKTQRLPKQALRNAFPKGMAVVEESALACDSQESGASPPPPLFALSGQGPFSARPPVQPKGPLLDPIRDVQAPRAHLAGPKSSDEMMLSFDRPSMLFEGRELDPSSALQVPRASPPRNNTNELTSPMQSESRELESSTALQVPRASPPKSNTNEMSFCDRVGGTTKSWSKIDLDADRGRANMDQVAMSAQSEKFVQKEMSTFGREGSHLTRSKTVVMVPVGRRCHVPVFSPHGKVRMMWLLLGFLFIIYEIFAIPVYIAFQVRLTPDESPLMFIVASVINTYFMLDIPLAFMSGYVDSHGKTVMNLRLIARHYRKSGFFFDLIAAVPWEWVGAGFDDSDVKALGIVRSFRLLRLTRFLHLVKLKHSLERFQSVVEASKLFTFVIGVTKTLSMLFAITHWAACVWYYVGSENEQARIDANLVENLSRPERYVYCLYFAWTTMTTVGYGDITPESFDEVCFVLGLLFISSVVFAYLMGSLTDLLVALNAETRALAERKTKLSRYLQWREVPDILVWKIRQHLLFLWNTNAGYDAFEDDIKCELPPVLRTELCSHVYGRVVRRAPWLAWMRDYPVCVKHLCNLVSSLFLDTGDTVFQMGEFNVNVYVLLTGSVWISRNSYLFDSKFVVNGDMIDEYNEDMNIPRNCGSRWPDVEEQVSRLLRRAGKTVSTFFFSSRGEQRRDTSSDSELAMARAVVALQDMTRETTDQTQGTQGGYRFNQRALETADIRLRRWELRMRSAALVVQRAWRRHIAKHAEVEMDKLGTGLSSRLNPPGKLLSKTVKAPAYFGESCLWMPLDEWEVSEPPAYLYTVRCVSRCELVHIPRTAILEVINRFSPWLAERFEFFRTAVVDLMEHEGCEGLDANHRPSLAYDQHAADLEMPRMDASAELARHSRGLHRLSTNGASPSRRDLAEGWAPSP